MKKFLFLIFFLLFISVLFMWDHELTAFWVDPDNRTFLVTEFFMWMNQYPGVIDFLYSYRYSLLILGVSLFALSFFLKKRKQEKERIKNTIFTGKKVIYDANEILSKESLPESEKMREKKAKSGPALIKIDEEKKKPAPKPEPDDDLDPETMRRILESK